MKTLDEIYTEVLESEELIAQFKALQSAEAQVAFVKAQGGEATAEEIAAFLSQKNSSEGELNDGFAYFKEGELLAYTLVTQPNAESVVIEQISTADRLIGQGVVLAPLAKTMRAIRQKPDIAQMKMTIYDDNSRSRRLVLHLLRDVEIKQVTNLTFFYSRNLFAENEQ